MRARRHAIELKIDRWSALAPGLEDPESWRAWADGTRQISGAVTADVRFVERLLRRRLSPLNRMAFKVAADCLEGEKSDPLIVFCSRYGEFSRAYEILKDLARDEPVSPKIFSLSVHNTASSLFSIMRQDNSPSMALAAGEATLEAGFLECWTLLQERAARSSLLIYCDQILPEMFSKHVSSVHCDIALALLLRLPREEKDTSALGLSWRPNTADPTATEKIAGNSALSVLKLLFKGGEQIASGFDRLSWTWKYNGASA